MTNLLYGMLVPRASQSYNRGKRDENNILRGSAITLEEIKLLPVAECDDMIKMLAKLIIRANEEVAWGNFLHSTWKNT